MLNRLAQLERQINTMHEEYIQYAQRVEALRRTQVLPPKVLQEAVVHIQRYWAVHAQLIGLARETYRTRVPEQEAMLERITAKMATFLMVLPRPVMHERRF